MDFSQIKVMMYLDAVTRDTGCLRVIPGSHRMPLHKDLAEQEINGNAQPFAVEGKDLPCMALESKPGDVILFNHCIWHSAYGGGKDRRYVAMKFAAKPSRKDQLISLKKYTPKVFEPHDAFLAHENRKIREMVEHMARYSEGEL
jgi:ectoine hydroxylase-related dioxygenase (phytanoyl-CoA dioxygenase family)